MSELEKALTAIMKPGFGQTSAKVDAPASDLPAFDRLSTLERERVDHDAKETLYAVFNAAHNATGWSGDIMEECWGAGLPIMKETMAKLVLRTR